MRSGRKSAPYDARLEPGRAYTRSYSAKVRAERKAQGLCHHCGERPRAEHVYCDVCRDERLKNYHSKYRDKRMSDHKTKHLELKREIFTAYGGARCACCGETREEFLSIDHSNNDGAQLRREKRHPRSGAAFYGWLKSHGFPPGFAIWCMNCNFAKGHFGACPHQAEFDSASVLSLVGDCG